MHYARGVSSLRFESLNGKVAFFHKAFLLGWGEIPQRENSARRTASSSLAIRNLVNGEKIKKKEVVV